MAWRNSGMPLDGVYFGEPGGERLGGSILDELRRVKIRFTGAKADNIRACCFHGLGLGVNGKRERGRQQSGTLGNAIIHIKPAERLRTMR